MNLPEFWKGNVGDVENVLSKVKKGKIHTICKTAGGREMKMVEYGEKYEFDRKANYSSAMGGRKKECYADKTGDNYKPCVLLLGAVHGGEFEGTVALNNFISLIETGVDLAGNRNDELVKSIEGVHLLIVPCVNLDGRARLKLETFAGMNFEDFRYYSQGTWKDGSLCGWPGCKQVHPLKDQCDFLGGYFNDDGVNIMHDNFFKPMAEETKALLRLADEYVPDMTIMLHGGSNCRQFFFAVDYVPNFVYNRIHELQGEVVKTCVKRGADPEQFNNRPVPRNNYHADPEPSYNICSAWTALCGEVCVTYESNQALDIPDTPVFSLEDIYKQHLVLFEATCNYVKKLNLKK